MQLSLRVFDGHQPGSRLTPDVDQLLSVAGKEELKLPLLHFIPAFFAWYFCCALPISCADFPLTLASLARGYRLTLEGKCNLRQKLTLARKLLVQDSLLLAKKKK